MQRATDERAEAGKMSDHDVLVDRNSHMVSQNLQAPYAIKKSRGMWVFDTPEVLPILEKNKARIIELLRQYSGLEINECTKLCDYLIQDNQRQALPENPVLDLDSLALHYLKSISRTNLGLGDLLGEGRFRVCIEPNDQFQARMSKQLFFLRNCIDAGAEVLCIQEQPYDSRHDQVRLKIFRQVMQEHGYVQIKGLAERDVGIWVKSGNTKFYKDISDKNLEKQITSDPFRGCVIERDGAIYVNVHSYTRDETTSSYAEKLLALKKSLEKYAASKNAQVVITGDLNLYQLKPQIVKTLTDAGFRLLPIRGQEQFTDKTYEGFTFAMKPVTRFTLKVESNSPVTANNRTNQTLALSIIHAYVNSEGRGSTDFKKIFNDKELGQNPLLILMKLQAEAIKQLGAMGSPTQFRGGSKEDFRLYTMLKDIDLNNPDIAKLQSLQSKDAKPTVKK